MTGPATSNGLINLAEGAQTQGYTTLRATAKARLAQEGLPTIKDEDWKYTPTREIIESAWSLVTDNGQPQPIPPIDPDAIQVMFVNGRLAAPLPVTLPTGLTIASLATEDPRIGTVAGTQTHGFAALNTALFSDGALVSVAPGTEVTQTIEVLFVSQGSGQVVAPRLYIDVAKQASLKVVERYVSAPSAKNLTLSVTEVDVQANAVLEHVRIQDENTDGYSVALWATSQAEGSTCEAFNIAFGGSIARLDQNIQINGRNATSRLDGVVVSDGNQLVDNHTSLDHAVPDCKSYEIYKQVANGASTIVFNGKIFVRQDAQKTDAKQTNQAILLSPKATVNSKPQLEIFADDVKCTHGATVGQIEGTPLFYMKSRGIPHETAQAILVYAFAAEVIELVYVKPVRKHLEERLFQKLGITAPE